MEEANTKIQVPTLRGGMVLMYIKPVSIFRVLSQKDLMMATSMLY